MSQIIALLLTLILSFSTISMTVFNKQDYYIDTEIPLDTEEYVETEEPGSDTDSYLYDNGGNVPEDVVFPGESFTVLCREDNAWGEYFYEIAADEDSTELIDQAVYKRNLEVEERFMLDEINYAAIPGHWAVNEDFVNTFRNSILAYEGAYDLIVSDYNYMADITLISLYTNVYDVPYVGDNLGAEYYNNDFAENVTVNGKLYQMLGDYNLTYLDSAYVLYFNKTIAEQYNTGDLYQTVRDGEWTFDAMAELVKGKWCDLNGDLWPDTSDVFGYVSDIPNTTDALWDMFDVSMIEKDANGEPVIAVDQGKVVNILERFIEFKKTDDTYFMQTDSSMTLDSTDTVKIFSEGRALFYPATLGKAKEFRNSETNFGILPYPKWDDSQEKYQTRSKDFSVAVFPADAPNLALSGAVYDDMCARSHNEVIPALYDSALRDKYSRDDESGEMLDMIFDGLVCSFGHYYGQSLDMGYEFRSLISQDNTNFVSYYAVNMKGYERKLAALLSAYE